MYGLIRLDETNTMAPLLLLLHFEMKKLFAE